MSLILERSTAALKTLERLQAAPIEGNGPTGHVDEVKQALLDLAAQTELFPLAHYPVKPGSRGGFYRVIEGADRRNAIYVSVAAPAVPGERRGNTPHRHVAWATIVGIVGEEFNAIYDRIDDGQTPGRGKLHKRAEITIHPGEAAFLPEGDYHHIELNGSVPSLHLHVYGLGVDSPEQARQPIFPSPDSEEYLVGGRPEGLSRIAVPVVSPAEVAELGKRGPVTILAVDGDTAAAAPSCVSAAIPVSSTAGLPATAIPADPATPVVLSGGIEAVEITAETLARHGVRTLLRLPFA